MKPGIRDIGRTSAFHRNQLTQTYENNERNVIDGFSIFRFILAILLGALSQHKSSSFEFENATFCKGLGARSTFHRLYSVDLTIFHVFFDRIRHNLLRVCLDAVHIDLLSSHSNGLKRHKRNNAKALKTLLSFLCVAVNQRK